MTALIIAVAAAAVLLLLLLLLLHQQESFHGIPSPGYWPIIGSYFHMKEPWHEFIYEKFHQYPIIHLKFGMKNIFVFNKWQQYKEAMIDNADALSGRPSQLVTELMFGTDGGLVMSDGTVWQEYRRFSLRALRDLGLGRKGVEASVIEEADILIKKLREKDGLRVDSHNILSESISNIVCQLVFGKRLASEDPKFGELLSLLTKLTQNPQTRISDYLILSIEPISQKFPFILKLLMQNPAAKQIFGSFKELLNFCDLQLQLRRSNQQHLIHPKDFIDSHIIQQQNSSNSIFSDLRLSLAVADLFIAGTDTTSSTLRWSLLYMICYSEIADQVRHEIHENIGMQMPQNIHKKLLNFTQAVIEEILRLSSLVSMGLPHRLLQDIQIDNVTLPKDSICYFNVYAIHRDTSVFSNPEEFHPQRHLRDGVFSMCDKLASFGSGRRSCLGESLARTELFIMFTSIMQNFHFHLHHSETKSAIQLISENNLHCGTLIRNAPSFELTFNPINI